MKWNEKFSNNKGEIRWKGVLFDYFIKGYVIMCDLDRVSRVYIKIFERMAGLIFLRLIVWSCLNLKK